MNWFYNLTGFDETSFDETKSKLTYNNGTLYTPKKSYQTGSFHEYTYNDLIHDLPSGLLSLNEIISDISILYKKYPNATFQVASQINCLEMANPNITKYQGITRYRYDLTQGPASAIAAGPGTIYRNYFLPDIDLLDNLPKFYNNQNGYCFPNYLPDNLDYQKIKVGYLKNTQVNDHFVNQVFCSALPIGYIHNYNKEYDILAYHMLYYSYYNTLLLALKNYEETHNNIVFLTMLGCGAFRNDKTMVIKVLTKILKRLEFTPLDVYIVDKYPNPLFKKLYNSLC